MKTLVAAFALALMSAPLFAQEQEYYSSYSQFEQYAADKDYVSLLGDKVNVRKSDSEKAEIVATLPIGTNVQLLAQSNKKYSMKGHTAHWYEVSYPENGSYKKGYIWGGMIAEPNVNYGDDLQDEKIEFAYGIDNVKATVSEYDGGKYTDYTVFIQLRAYQDGKELGKITFESPSVLTSSHSLQVTSNRGISGVSNVLELSFSGEACGVPSGNVYVFWTGKELKMVRTTNSFADAPVFADETLIFPTDEGGKAGKILLKEEAGEYPDDSDEPVYSTNKTTEFVWTGSALKESK